jgi:hypothetical protein
MLAGTADIEIGLQCLRMCAVHAYSDLREGLLAIYINRYVIIEAGMHNNCISAILLFILQFIRGFGNHIATYAIKATYYRLNYF